MERARGDENGDVEDRRRSSESKDDSLKDFKSPKMERATKPLSGKSKVVGEKRPKKPSSKGKSSAANKKKEGSASGRQNERAQPSIESSFFKAGTTGKREGHTCPLCMRHFEDVHEGTRHTKSCAAKNKVSTTKLLAAVALQERQADERLAIGLPAGPLVQSKDRTPRRKRGAQTLKGDSDLQLALALSKSLQENQAERELEEALLLAAEHRGDEPMPGITDSQRRSTLKNFGFLTNKPVSGVPVMPRRKKHLGPTILQTRTQESRDRLLTERIAEILMGNEAITQVCRQEPVTEVNNVEKPPVVLKSRLLKEIHISTKRLWNSAELSKGVTNFYVEDLRAIVAPASDREENDSATSSQRNPRSEADSPQHSNTREVEADSKSEKMSSSSNDRPNDAEDRAESPKNSYVTDRQYRNNLPTDWSNTLNVSTMSDVVVLVDKNHIWAHKLVFHVRCSNILLDCEPIDDKRFRHVREKISWPEVDYLTALAFLEFVYSGVIVKNEHVFADDRVASMVRNLARKYRLKDLFEYMRKRKSEIERRSEEGRRSGLRSPIVIEIARRDCDAEVAVEDKEEPGASTSSPRRRSCIVDLTIAKTPDQQFIEDDAPSIDNASAKDRNRSVTSPDIFDDSTEDAETNSPEAAEASARDSSNENSNLRVLAQLIAEDNLSRRDEANESDASSTASTFVDEGRPEESPVAKRSPKKPSQTHLETPRSRTSSVSNDSKKINDRKKSMSQRLPEKQKSNLSIFIEKVRRINAKSVLDSYNEEESLGEPYDRERYRNPFNVNNESNKSTSDAEGRAEGRLVAKKGALSALEEQLMLHQEKKNNVIDPTSDESAVFEESSMNCSLEEEAEGERFMAGKRALGSLEQQSMPQDERKENGIDQTLAEESAVLNDSSSTCNLDEESSVLENAASTDDENISMYSRYKKTHKHNNSINKYRSLLIKLTEASAAASEDDSTTRIEEAIDLTQESDSEVESSPSFNVRRSKKRCIRAIVSESNDSMVSRENDGAEDKSFSAGELDDAIALSDDAADESFDDAETTSPLSKGAVDRDEGKNVASSVDRRKNLSTSPEYPDPQARELDEEMFSQSLKSRRTLTPSPRLSTDSAGKSVSRRCKRKSNEAGSKDTNFVDELQKNEDSDRVGRSSRGPDSLSNFSQDPEKFVSRICKRKSNEAGSKDTNFVDILQKNEDSDRVGRSSRFPDRLSNFSQDPEKSVTRRCKPKSNEAGSKDTNFVDILQKNEDSDRVGRSSRGPDSLSNFSQDPEKSVTRRYKPKSNEAGSKDTNFVDKLQKNEDSDRVGRSSRGPDRLSNFSQDPEKFVSRRCKPKSNEAGSKDTNFVDKLQKNEDSDRVGRSSRGPDRLSNFSQNPEKFVSRRCKPKSNEAGSKDTNFVSNSEKNEESHLAGRSSRGPDSLHNFEIDEEIFARSLKSRRTLTPSPRPSTDSAEKSASRRCKRKSDEGGSKATSLVDNSKKSEKSQRTSRSSRGADGFSHSSQYPDLDVFEVDEDIFAQSFGSPASPGGAKRKSGSSSRKRGSDEKRESKAKDTTIVDDSERSADEEEASSNGRKKRRSSPAYSDFDVFEVNDQVFTQSFGSPASPGGAKRKSGSLSRKRGSDEKRESKAKDTTIVDDSERSADEEEASSDGRKKRRSSPAYSDFDVFEVNDQVFTQSFRSPSPSPRRALTPSPTEDGERGRNETPRLPSPILISSSPDMDADNARPATKAHDSNKENSFLVAEENAGPFYAGRYTLSPPRLDEPSSPKPGPSRRRFSPECSGISPSAAKNPLVRWNSMPTSSTKAQKLKRTRTPTKSSRVALSQGVTPPVNYEAMDTPELKRELEKYGIKPQKAHRARQLLTHIYNELHSKVPTASSDAASDEDEEPPAKKIVRTCSQSSEDSEPESVTSAVSIIPEEIEYADGDAPSNGGDDASNKSSVKQAFTALIEEDKELQNKMLTYEPLPLELLHSMLKARGFKCKVNDLMDFLDEECITFRVQDQARRQKANRGRGKKTAANGTRRPKSQKS